MTQNEYLLAWTIYLSSFAIAYGVFWFISAKLPFRELRQLLRIVLAVFFLVPWTTDTAHSYWSPAWMISISDSLLLGTKAFWRAGLALVLALIFAVLISTFISLFLWFRSRKKSIDTDTSSSNETEVEASTP